MNILAIDTAGKTAAVAVMRDDTLLYEMASNTGLTPVSYTHLLPNFGYKKTAILIPKNCGVQHFSNFLA